MLPLDIIVWFILSVIKVSSSQRWPLSGTCHPCQCKTIQKDHGRVKYVNCLNLSLSRIPRNLPLDLHVLDLSYNQVLPQDLKQLCRFRSIQETQLSFNKLTKIPPNSFDNCHDLLTLNLTGNRLALIDSKTLQGLENIQNLHGLEVDQIKETTFRKLANLKLLELSIHGDNLYESLFKTLSIEELKLSVFALQTLPSKLFDFGAKTLKALSVIGPNIRFLSENSFQGLAVLRKVHLDLWNLRTLPEKIFHGNGGAEKLDTSKPQNLQEIWIVNVGSIPENVFKGLKNLQKLVLHDVPSLSEGDIFCDLVNLVFLDITGSDINRIPLKWFEQLFSLKTLKLTKTGLRDIDKKDLEGLINLQNLDLSFNGLRQLGGESFKPINNSVRTISLHGNMLKYIDRKLFLSMTNLVSLDISDNKLEEFHPDAFKDLRQLISLNIHDNKLATFPDTLFKNLGNLETLNLASNKFSDFPIALDKLSFLWSLNLSDNRIGQLPNNFLNRFPYLEYLNLNYNPLYCVCEELHQIKLLRPDLVLIGTCVFPEELTGRHISDISNTDCLQETTSAIQPSSAFSSNTAAILSLATNLYTSETQPTSLNYNTSSLVTAASNTILDFTTEAVFTSMDIRSTSSIQPTTRTLPAETSSTRTDLPPITSGIITSPISTTPRDSFSHIVPTAQEELANDSVTDQLVFRVSIGVFCGAMFICGSVAFILWRKRVEQRKRYEVTANTPRTGQVV